MARRALLLSLGGLVVAASSSNDDAIRASIAAYASTLSAAPAYATLAAQVPTHFGGNLDDLDRLVPEGGRDLATLPPGVQAFLQSAASVEQSIAGTTLAPAEASSSAAADLAAARSVFAYASSLTTDPRVQSVASLLPIPVDWWYVDRPLIASEATRLPADAQSLISSVIAAEERIARKTVTQLDLDAPLPLPGTTLAAGTYVATAESTSEAHAAPAYGGGYPLVAGLGVGVAVGLM